jgi:FtsP/CotA-like multicopper oxidase with cupredoxin domain
MKNRLGWSLATLAILTFSFGQATATASQVVTSQDAASALTATAAPPTVKPAKASPKPTLPATVKAHVTVIKPHSMAGKPLPPKKAPVLKPLVKASGLGALNAPTSPTDQTKVPHYFGPYSNWANSPQVLANAIVTIGGVTSGGGSGATATATVDPRTGGVTGYTITNPGTGYTSAPDVAVTSPGVPTATGATATAVISTGVVTSVTVNQSGFGYTTPSVAITGGGTPSVTATAVASGGVDSLNLTAGGGGYTFQPIVEFSLPNAAYCLTTPPPVPACQAPTAVADKNSSNVVTSVSLTGLGTGYTSLPTVTILNGNVPAATPATAVPTINIGRIDITNGGAGYTSAPTVTITDTTGTGSGATATASVAALGAVSAINVVTPGSGYLTPGIKKFVDTLSGFGPSTANNLGNYIPVAVPDTTTYPGTDYYEIGVVQYRQQFATSLPATLLRGYVQLSTSVVPGAHVQLTNANVNPAVADVNIAGRFGVDKPYYLGPTIMASKNRPVRVLFRNLLPTGVAGDLFLPVDTSIMGSGYGPAGVTLGAGNVPNPPAPDLGTVTDQIRNPACNDTPKPITCYTENRATLHLHGGVTPWISDGTPHQWTTPAGESTDYPKGVSVSNVPDMPDPGPGAETFFYTNQQSARLMFYHDHSWGITRMNVYAGEAAGYLVTDATEAKLLAPGGAMAGLGAGTPLMIQDKTFVPASVATTDPTWEGSQWGGTGSLWTPHVYMPVSNPWAADGVNPIGRWIYGPWFWPPVTNPVYPPINNPYYDPTCNPNVTTFCEPPQIPSTPNISDTMEAFQDTPIVNGTAYPTTTVDPKAYRYRILNAGNDRFWNLSWYVADPSTGTLSEVALNPEQLAAAQTDPNIVPAPDTTKSPAGPNWIQVANEGGFLPTPAVIPAQPITWITDATRFDWGNVDKHSLLLAPAERADVIVDFSQFRGKTLILYNDAPAAFPARQDNEDFYTGDPNMVSTGGAPTTLPGYGPNTRTVMQVHVSTAASAAPFNLAALNAAFAHHSDGSGVFESGQDPTIVGQAAYNTAYGTNFVTHGYCSSVAPPTQQCDGMARINQQGGDIFQFNTLGPLKNGLGAKLGIPLQPKALHDEANAADFDPFGRMQASLGLEAPGATPINQNIILYPFVNPPTENLNSAGLPSSLNVTPISSAADGTQIWKITHNGVDTHPIHFHLYSVQVINRVTWDNIIMPPDANEIGWKDTVRLSPLEDTYVAVRPIKPTLPFGIPDSSRLLNPAMPLNATGSTVGSGYEAGFNNVDTSGNPTTAPIVNTVFNFGWEYVWHCHMLSHEEMDMMRPVTLATPRALPAAPNPVTVTGTATLHWFDGTPVDYTNPATWSAGSDPGTSEIGFRIQRATISSTGVVGAYTVITTALANTTSYTDTTAVTGQRYRYQVIAFNAAGNSPSTPISVGTAGFVGTTPTRVLDTRNGTGGVPVAKLGAGRTVTLTVPGLPAGTTSVALNVTAIGGSATSWLTVYPGGATRPVTSTVNFATGQTIANMVEVPVGAGNTVTFYNSTGTVDVTADLLGYYQTAAGGGFTGQTSTRVMDTRTGLGAPHAKIGAGGTVTLTVPGLPVGTTAVALSVGATNPTATSWLTVYQGGQARPVTSNVNFVAGQTISNMVTVPVGPGNTVTFYNSTGTVDVTADLLGYFQPGSGAGFNGITSTRVLDTRNGTGAPRAKLGAGGTLTLTVPGLPAGATSVALNITAIGGSATSWLTVYPGGATRPGTSTVNYGPGQSIASMVVLPLGPGNTVNIWNSSGTVDVTADLLGSYS